MGGLSFTYDTLVSAIQQYTLEGVSLTNTDFSAFLPTIIQIAEDRLIRDLNSNVFDVEMTSTLKAADPLLSIPEGFLGIRYLRISTDGLTYTPLKRVDITWLQNYWRQPTATGVPLYYAVWGNNGTTGGDDSYLPGSFQFAPTPASPYSYILRYIQRPPSLSPDNQTTWLSINAPDVFLYACLAESMAYLREDIPSESGMTQMFEAKYARELAKLKTELSDQIITGLYY